MLSKDQLDAIAEADDICRQDPVQAGIRDELLRMEREATRDGFNPNDTERIHLFQFLVHESGKVEVLPLAIMTEVIRHFTGFLNSLPGAMELVSVMLTDPDAAPIAMSPAVQAATATMFHEHPIPDGWRLCGLGMSGEVLSIHAEHPDVHKVVGSGQMDSPGILPVWFGHAMGVDSRSWAVMRQSDAQPVYATSSPDVPGEPFPGADAMTRMVVAMTDQ